MKLLRPGLLSFVLALPIIFGGLWPAEAVRAQSAAFVSVIGDLPLMAGLEEDSDAAVVFETASGRIAQAYASGVLEHRSIREFYAATLPQLGWHLETLSRYRREGEVLTLEIQADAGQPGLTVVHFELAPAAP